MRLRVARSGVFVVSILVMALAVAAGWWAAELRSDTRPVLTSALDTLPARTNVVGFTDWSEIRDHVGLDEVDTAGERAELQSRFSARDITTRSVISRAVEEMHDLLGWSPADVDWEVYGQDSVGAQAVVRLEDWISFDDVRATLRSTGYRQDGDTWSVDRRTGLPDITTHIALVPRQRLIVMSGQKDRVPDALAVVDGRARSLASIHAAAATAQALAGNDSVLLQGGRLACDSTAVTGGDRERQARAAVERAGGALEPYRYSGRGIVDRGGSGFSAQRVVFAMTFESAVTASEQARLRTRLATGPFIGRLGPIAETLRLRSTQADEATVRLEFAHDPKTDAFMTGVGPVLFATCAA